jgi:DDE domain
MDALQAVKTPTCHRIIRGSPRVGERRRALSGKRPAGSGGFGVGCGHGSDLLSPPPLPAGCHPACCVGYLRFTLSYRDVEDLLAERGLDISYETIRSWVETIRNWVLKFGLVTARRLRRRPPRPSDRWQLDEMVVRIAGERLYLRRAIDHEGEVLGKLVQRRHNWGTRPRIVAKLATCVGWERIAPVFRWRQVSRDHGRSAQRSSASYTTGDDR